MHSYIRINNNEQKLWEGGPDKKVCTLEAIFNPMLPVAVIWGGIDGALLISGATGKMGFEQSSGIMFFLVPFLLVHMMPVWMYIGGVIFAGIKAKNTRYVLTDHALYFQKGIFSISTERMPLNEVTHSGIHIGIIDRICGTGDVMVECVHEKHSLSNISDFEYVCNLISQVSVDQYTDTMYPNQYRPDVNPGYQTQYRPASGFERNDRYNDNRYDRR